MSPLVTITNNEVFICAYLSLSKIKTASPNFRNTDLLNRTSGFREVLRITKNLDGGYKTESFNRCCTFFLQEKTEVKRSDS